MMRHFPFLFTILFAASFLMAAGSVPSNNLQIGDGTASNKTITFNKGLGASNPKFRWNNGTGKLQFSEDGSSFVNILQGSLGADFAAVVGSSAQVSAGQATHTSINTAIAAVSSGDAIKVLTGTYVENVSVNKRLYISGVGNGTTISGTLTLASGSSLSMVSNLRTTGDVTINSGVDGANVSPIWLASGKTFIDNSDVTASNYLFGIQE